MLAWATRWQTAWGPACCGIRRVLRVISMAPCVRTCRAGRMIFSPGLARMARSLAQVLGELGFMKMASLAFNGVSPTHSGKEAIHAQSYPRTGFSLDQFGAATPGRCAGVAFFATVGCQSCARSVGGRTGCFSRAPVHALDDVVDFSVPSVGPLAMLSAGRGPAFGLSAGAGTAGVLFGNRCLLSGAATLARSCRQAAHAADRQAIARPRIAPGLALERTLGQTRGWHDRVHARQAGQPESLSAAFVAKTGGGLSLGPFALD